MTESPPKGLGIGGRRLWRTVTGAFELEEHELTLLRQAVRVVDTCDTLQAIVDAEGVIVHGKSHAAAVELRLQRVLLGRLLAAMRVPTDDEGEPDPSSGRPRRRALRGFYGGAE